MNGYGQLILARIVVVLDLWLFGHFTLLPALGRSAFRFRQIDPILPKFRRPLSQSVLALSTFFGRCIGIYDFFDGLCGQIFRASGTRWRGLLCSLFDGEPELDQAADGLGAGCSIMLIGPCLYVFKQRSRQPDAYERIAPCRRPTPFRFYRY